MTPTLYDCLPTNKTELEGLCNYHVSQLETLARRVKLLNEYIDLDSIVLSNLRQDDKSNVAAAMMTVRIEAQLQCKRDMAVNVNYHRGQLRTVLRALMKEKNGITNGATNGSSISNEDAEDKVPVCVSPFRNPVLEHLHCISTY